MPTTRAREVAEQAGVLLGQRAHEARGVGDVEGLVAYALHVRYHLQRGGDEAQVARDGLLLQKELEAERLNLALLLVYLILEVADALGERPVVVHDGARGGGDGLLAERAHGDKLVVEQGELLVEFYAHISRTSL